MMMMMMKTKQKKKMREQGTRGRRSVVGGIPIPGFSLSGAVEASRRLLQSVAPTREAQAKPALLVCQDEIRVAKVGR